MIAFIDNSLACALSPCVSSTVSVSNPLPRSAIASFAASSIFLPVSPVAPGADKGSSIVIFVEPLPIDCVAWDRPATAASFCTPGAAIAAGSSASEMLPFDWQPDNVTASAKATALVRSQRTCRPASMIFHPMCRRVTSRSDLPVMSRLSCAVLWFFSLQKAGL
ncbi:hypothetical protein [Mesorhizobium sp.]|uniref:hypothetical protein n=1 Tax=Mesorhizobium sp. TaxID=1871066 RepID=UPI0025D44D68|nr:hypothetical protein [Mesorhizobium sp.]